VRHPGSLIDAVLASDARDLTAISNNAGVDNFGLGKLLLASYVGGKQEIRAAMPRGRARTGVHPAGTLAEKLRAAGAGIPAFFTRIGVDTVLADVKELREFAGKTYALEESLLPELSLTKAWKADRAGTWYSAYGAQLVKGDDHIAARQSTKIRDALNECR